MSERRSFLFLQSVCSPFFARLADRLAAEGHRVAKLDFNGGDVAYWWPRPAARFRGGLDELPGFLGRHYEQLGVTDLVLFGDRRPVHRPAIERAKPLGIRVHVFEEAYFRPHWVTLERGGVNAHSPLPRDPGWFRAVGARLPEPAASAFHSPFWIRAAHDVAYHVAGLANPLAFPRYRTHAPAAAPAEYLGYLRRFAWLRLRRAADAAALARLEDARFYVLPLQLNSDAQIRDHSPFDGMAAVIAHVLASFARHAPPQARLLVKNHPLDNGLLDYQALVGGLAADFGLAGRVEYLEGGRLEPLLPRALGLVTVNSTAGMLALGFGCPVLALSDPIYNLEGLCFQGGLDDFWAARPTPDAALFRCFRNTVIHAAQVNGGFYCDPGIALAVEHSLPRLLAGRSPLEELL